jgi:hypothetical protein
MKNGTAWRLSWAMAWGSALVTGCSSTEVLKPAMEVTVGQQLIDLKRARDAGALSADEWEREKRNLIRSVR